MKYAIIQTGGKQYKVHEGDVVAVERLSEVSPKAEVVFDTVLLVAGDSAVQLGTPTIPGTVVRGVLQEEVRGPKIRVMKYKAKVRHRRATGHRQKLSQVLIQSIGSAKTAEKSVTKASSSTSAKPARKAKTA